MNPILALAVGGPVVVVAMFIVTQFMGQAACRSGEHAWERQTRTVYRKHDGGGAFRCVAHRVREQREVCGRWGCPAVRGPWAEVHDGGCLQGVTLPAPWSDELHEHGRVVIDG